MNNGSHGVASAAVLAFWGASFSLLTLLVMVIITHGFSNLNSLFTVPSTTTVA